MDRNGNGSGPSVVIEGLEDIIRRDLLKHKALRDRSSTELEVYRRARSQEVAKKKNYRRLIGGGKFNDDALRESIKQININIRHWSDKIKLSEEARDHHIHIVDTLTAQLDAQLKGLSDLDNSRRVNRASDD